MQHFFKFLLHQAFQNGIYNAGIYSLLQAALKFVQPAYVSHHYAPTLWGIKYRGKIGGPQPLRHLYQHWLSFQFAIMLHTFNCIDKVCGGVWRADKNVLRSNFSGKPPPPKKKKIQSPKCESHTSRTRLHHAVGTTLTAMHAKIWRLASTELPP